MNAARGWIGATCLLLFTGATFLITFLFPFTRGLKVMYSDLGMSAIPAPTLLLFEYLELARCFGFILFPLELAGVYAAWRFAPARLRPLFDCACLFFLFFTWIVLMVGTYMPLIQLFRMLAG